MSEIDSETSAKKSKPKQAQWKDVYQTSTEFKSRLFKLLPAKMLKSIMQGQDQSSIQEVTHQHFHHTIDSSGKVQDHSVAVGGHFHIMTIKEDPNTGEPIATCSGPKTFAYRKNKKVIVDLKSFGVDDRGNDIMDTHTHEVIYERTSKIKPRTVNAESLKIIDQLESSKVAPIEGIKG